MSVNYYDLCRICTANSEHKTHLFSAEGKRKNLTSKIAESLAIHIDEKDRLPKMLCAQCMQQIENYLDFRNISKKSQVTLSEWLNSAIGGKVFIKDELATGTNKSLNVVAGNNSTVFNVTQAATQQIPMVTVHNPATTLLQSGNDILNSIIQVAGLQQANDASQAAEKQILQQYTITMDNNKLQKAVTLDGSKLMQQQQQSQAQQQDRDTKHNALEEFLRLKPNIKVRTVKKEAEKQQTQQQQQQETPQQLVAMPVPQTTQQQPQQLTQIQLQHILQQQLQQQQLQQQLQQLTQLQQQQITLSAPPTQTASVNLNVDAANTNDPLSPNRDTRPKINFVLTPPTAHTTSTSAVTTASATQPTPQIQLQFQTTPTAASLNAINTQQQQQQQTHNNAAALLSNLAPLLQQNVGVTTPLTASSGTTMLSPNKCFLPITIKDENSDQQIVAHIDAKNFVFPTTYQLQMKLQPQIATVDGQTIMQLTPTSIPATLQLAPQALTNQTFQALFNPVGNLQQAQMLQSTQQQQQQVPLPQQQSLPQQQPLPQQHLQQLSQPHQPSSNTLQITSHQIIKPPNNSSNIISNAQPQSQSTSDVMNSQQTEVQNVDVTSKTQIIPPQKYKITQLAGSNMYEITATNDFSPQIVQQPKPKRTQPEQQQQQSIQINTTNNTLPTIPTQYGGITVQRISTTTKPTTTINTKPAQQQQQLATKPATTALTTSTTATASPKPNIWNKQNLTISRITTQPQIQQQQQATTQIKLESNTIKQPLQQQQKHIQQAKLTQQLPTQKQQTQQSQQQQQQQQNNSPSPKKAMKRFVTSKLESPLKSLQSTTTTLPASTETTSASYTVSSPTTSSTTATPIKLPTKANVTNTTKTTVATSTDADADTIAVASTPGFECNQCHRVFKKKEHLTQHAKLHVGLRPFKCSHDGCDKDFSRKEHLMRHLISHSGQKKFSCDVCEKPFSRKDNLNKHRRIHATSQNSSNYTCDICNKSFSVKAYYEEHKLLHEKQDSSASPPQKKKSKMAVNNSNTTHQQQQQHDTQQQQQIQIVQQPQQQQQLQQQQIMQIQLPTVVTTQDLAGNTITITQSSDLNKTIGTHDTTVLNLPPHIASLVQLGPTQFVNTATGQIVGHIKIDKG